MPRPHRHRIILNAPDVVRFKPAGVPSTALEEIVLGVDELEAVRLADFEGLYQEEAAARMNVSRATFGRIVAQARRKVAAMIVEGRSLRIEGGPVTLAEIRSFHCRGCGHAWQEPRGTGRPEICPACSDEDIHRTDALRGRGGGGGGRGRGRGRRGRP